jgi:hypothetical protein
MHKGSATPPARAACPAAPGGHNRWMHRQTVVTVLRWLFIGFWLALYWWGVASAIAERRRGPDSKHTEWLEAVVLTLPWSFPGFSVAEGKADEPTWFTAVTVGGALLNSLIFTQIVRWLTRSPRRPPADGLPRPARL